MLYKGILLFLLLLIIILPFNNYAGDIILIIGLTFLRVLSDQPINISIT